MPVGGFGLAGLFCIFSSITPTMTQVADQPERLMPGVLEVFGIDMISGNIVGAKLVDRVLMLTIGAPCSGTS